MPRARSMVRRVAAVSHKLRADFNPDRAVTMFFMFSNKLGCIGSLVLSVGGTLLLLMLFGLVPVPGGW